MSLASLLSRSRVAACSSSLLLVCLLLLLHSASSSSSAAPTSIPYDPFPPPFPIFASAYDAQLSLFFPLSSFSLSYRERFSLAANRMRRDGHFAPLDSSEWIDLSTGAVTVLNSSSSSSAACSVLSESQASHLYYLPSSAVLHLISVLPFSEWVYVDRSESVRNVLSDRWHIANLSVVASAASTLCHISDSGCYFCNEAPADVQGDYAQLLDLSNGLSSLPSSSSALPFIYNFSMDLLVQADSVAQLDGSVPVRLLISGTRRSALEGSPAVAFQHSYDWLQFQPLNRSDLEIDACDGAARGEYSPPVPRSIAQSSAPPPSLSLPALAHSFTMLSEERTTNIADMAFFSMPRFSPSVLWRRVDDARESTYTLRLHNHSTVSHSTYYNYSGEGAGGLVWDVSSACKGCSLSRLSVSNFNALAVPNRFLPSFLDLFKQSRQAELERFRYVGQEEVRGALCWRYDAVYSDVLAAHNVYSYTSSFYFAPPYWQYEPVSSGYLLPLLFRNDGLNLFYPAAHGFGDRTNRSVNESASSKSVKQKTDGDGEKGERDGGQDTQPIRIRFTDSWSVFGFSASPLPAFDLEALGCPSVAPPIFPLRPNSYASTVVVSSSLTSQTYGYTEYYDRQSGLYRADGRYHGVDDVEVTNLRTGESILFSNPRHDEAAFGYGSRVDFFYHLAGSGLHPLEPGLMTPCTVTRLNSSLLSSQFVKPTYVYYIELYPFSLWTHAESDTVNGFPVDVWQVVNRSTTTDGNLLFDTATFFFSLPSSVSDAQVPVRFQFSRVIIYTSEDEREEELEGTVVDFVQWAAVDFNLLHLLHPHQVFAAPNASSCTEETFDLRYQTLLDALDSPSDSREYTTLPRLPSSFTALVVTPLFPPSDELWALRWYVDNAGQRQRLDYAPLAMRSYVDWTAHNSVLYQYWDDYGAYQLHAFGCGLLSPTPDAVHPLLHHFTGTLPELFSGGFQRASVYEDDTVSGVAVMCFQREYKDVLNAYTNTTFSFRRQACFAQDDWEQIPISNGEQLASVEDSGTRTAWNAVTGQRETTRFTVRYDFLLIDSDEPSDSLFNLTSHHCQPTGVTYTPPAAAPADEQAADSPPYVVVAAVVVAVLGSLVLLKAVLDCRRRRQELRWEKEELMHPLSSSSSSHNLSSTSVEWEELPASASTAAASSGALDSEERIPQKSLGNRETR